MELAHINKSFMEEFPSNVTVQTVYFSDHDAVRIMNEKNFDLNTIPWNQTWSGNKGTFDGFQGFFNNFNSFITLVKVVAKWEKQGGGVRFCQLFETQHDIFSKPY